MDRFFEDKSEDSNSTDSHEHRSCSNSSGLGSGTSSPVSGVITEEYWSSRRSLQRQGEQSGVRDQLSSPPKKIVRHNRERMSEPNNLCFVAGAGPCSSSSSPDEEHGDEMDTAEVKTTASSSTETVHVQQPCSSSMSNGIVLPLRFIPDVVSTVSSYWNSPHKRELLVSRRRFLTLSSQSQTDDSSQASSSVCVDGQKSESNVKSSNYIMNAEFGSTTPSGSTLRQRNASMCNNQKYADVYFLVGKQLSDDYEHDEMSSASSSSSVRRFAAHKYVLAIGSEVFAAMFYGGLSEKAKEIRVPDVDPEAFFRMLEYLYSDKISLDEDVVISVLEVSKKYIIQPLAKACVQFMDYMLCANNACLILSHSQLYDELDLIKKCFRVIDAQTDLCFRSETFLDIDQSTLGKILSRDTLSCSEVSVYTAALNWAKAKCERNEVESSPHNLRSALGEDVWALIRFPTMKVHEFADGPAQSGILSKEECYELFLNFSATNKSQSHYNAFKRIGLDRQVCLRFRSTAYRSSQWRYRGRSDCIQFCVDKRIFLLGIGMYGSAGGSANYDMEIVIKRPVTGTHPGPNQSFSVLCEHEMKFITDGSSSTFPVYFPQPVQIDPGAYYTIYIVIKGDRLSYFGQEGMDEVVAGSVTFQFQCSQESTNGTGVQGGQIPELIFYGPE